MVPAILDVLDADRAATGDVAEGGLGLVVRFNPKTRERVMDKLSWGLLPHDTRYPLSASKPTHARAEGVAELPMFADAFQRRRALVPATEYAVRETKAATGKRFKVSRVDGTPMGWAGLWESFVWPDGRIDRTYCVITVPANVVVAPFRERMPLVLEPEDWSLWLGEIEGDPATLLRPVPEHVLSCTPVTRHIGKGRRRHV
jgi:putative SOS response-associated peptidase YedK